jgi:hypothetical protein
MTNYEDLLEPTDEWKQAYLNGEDLTIPRGYYNFYRGKEGLSILDSDQVIGYRLNHFDYLFYRHEGH